MMRPHEYDRLDHNSAEYRAYTWAKYNDPSHPHYIDLAKLHGYAGTELGRSPDTQPISDADYAKLRADAARGPLPARASDRLGNAFFGVIFAMLFTAVLAGLGLVFAGLHGAVYALGLGVPISIIAAIIGALDNRRI